MKLKFFAQMVYPVRSVSVSERSCTALTSKKFVVIRTLSRIGAGAEDFSSVLEIFAL
jgi:hypothetical protein